MNDTHARILSDLASQVGHYEQLLKLASRQRDLIAGDRADELLILLGERETVIAKMNLLDQRLRPVRAEWASVSGSLDAEVRQQAQAMFEKLRDLLGKITSSDADDALVLQQKKLDVRKQINATGQQLQVTRHYAADAYASQAKSNLNIIR